MLTPARFQDTRLGPATKVWDETEFLSLPGPAVGRYHCRWRQATGQPPSSILKHTKPAARRWLPFAIPSAAEREVIKQNERPQDRVNFDDSATIDPPQ